MTDLDPGVFAVLARAQRLGIIGKAPLDTHVDQARAFYRVVEDLVDPSSAVLDLGSGGGLPGLVIAACWSQLSVTLLDGRSNRAENLSVAVAELGLSGRVRVIARRAEEAGRDPRDRQRFDLVVARGFGPPAVTAECAAPFLRLGGLLVVSDPPGGGSAGRWPVDGCHTLGLELVRSVVEPWALTVLCQTALCGESYPRRTGLPHKRPLFV